MAQLVELGQDVHRGRAARRPPGGASAGLAGDGSQAEGRPVELGQDSQRWLARRYLVEVLRLWTIGPHMVHLGHKMRIVEFAFRPGGYTFSDGTETGFY